MTRKVLCKLPDMLGDGAPKFKPIDDAGSALIKNMVERLMNETYADDGTLQPTHEIPMAGVDHVQHHLRPAHLGAQPKRHPLDSRLVQARPHEKPPSGAATDEDVVA